MTHEIVHIDEYHRRADSRYYLAMDEYRAGVRSTVPSREMYMYVNQHGQPRRDGFVVITNGSGSKWFKLKRAAQRWVDDRDRFNATDR